MSKINYLFDRIKRVKDFGIKMSPIVGGETPFLTMMDFLMCYVMYGTDEEDYKALEFYKKSASEKKTFITARKNYHNLSVKHATDADKLVILSKYEFNKRFSSFIKRDWISTREHTPEEIEEFIKKHGQVMVKTEYGNSGLGVHKLSAKDAAGIKNLLIDINKKNNHYVIEEVISQHEEMAYFNDSCVNTCRIETITDKSGKAHFVNTVVISGGKGSHISNTHSGGVMIHVDLESGITDSKGRNPEGKQYLFHPGTGVLLLGHKLPYWQEATSLALKLAEELPTARYIGWDIALTENGPEVIEGNLYAGHCTQSTDMVGRWPIIKRYL